MTRYCDSGATFSKCGRYRYRLWRQWSSFLDVEREAVWILHNPSTADAEEDDPTIRRCVDFSKRWRCARMTILNRYALRATDPAVVKRALARGEAELEAW